MKKDKTTQAMLFIIILLLVIIVIGVFVFFKTGISSNNGNVIVTLG